MAEDISINAEMMLRGIDSLARQTDPDQEVDDFLNNLSIEDLKKAKQELVDKKLIKLNVTTH